MSGAREAKTCASCGRRIEWRKKWESDWDEVRYCSTACRRRRVGAVDEALERSILELLEHRAADATICPSEAARAVAADADRRDPAGGRATADRGDDADQPDPEAKGAEPWRALMEPARRAARRLVAAGEVEILQQGKVVDPSSAKGPIRVRRARGES